MSSNDPAPGQPPETPPVNGSITPPPADFQPTPATDGEHLSTPPGWQPEVAVPARPIAQKPRWPHPNFWWSALWCLLFLFTTQVPGAVLAVVALLVLMMVNPEILPPEALGDQAALFKSGPVATILAFVFLITELLVVTFSWLILRVIVGRDWARQVALRPPSAAHTLLAVASFPALVLLGNVSYELLRKSQWVPSVSDAGLLDVFYFWAAVFKILAVAMLVSLLIGGRGWTQRLASRPSRPADALLAAVILLVLLPFIFLDYQGLRWSLPVPGLAAVKFGGMEEMVEVFKTWPAGLAVLVIGLGPGIGEELWCRGFLGRGLVGNYGAVLGVLAASFFFGLIHLDPCQGTMAMLMGLWLHFVYLTTRSLWLPMLLHFLNNSLSVLGPKVSHLEFLDAKPETIPALVYVSTFLLLGAVAYALYQSRARLAPQTPGQICLWRPPYEGVEYPPSDSGMQVVHPTPSPAALALAGGSLALLVAAFVSWAQRG